jgi:D-3-phosphoglycerate dehydrogenase / 2-oxoglutarate reductase
MEREDKAGMKARVVVAYTTPGNTEIEERVLNGGNIEILATGDLTSPESIEAALTADAIMVTVQPVPSDLIAKMSNCKIVCRVGTGVDAISIPAATEHGIWVTNVPDYSIDEVSAHAMALLLAQARQLFPHRELARNGIWPYQTIRPIKRLADQTMGIVGLGRIGKASARKGNGLGLRVIAHDPYIDHAEFESVNAEPVDFETVLRESDFLTLHVPLTDETRQLINADALSKMKPTAYLVNTARGGVVDIDALVEAVRGDQIAGAGLDVLPEEPPDQYHPVMHDDRIIVTPHIAWASTEAGIDVKARGAEDVKRVLSGLKPIYACNQITA